MKQYQELLQDILQNGVRQGNRTGIDTLTLPGAMLKFDLRDGFPAVTTKKLAFGQVKRELIGFLYGLTSAADFRALGCTIWDQNANENAAWLDNPHRRGEDDLGRIYGAQWRRWSAPEIEEFDGPWSDETLYTVNDKPVDQIAIALDTLRHNPQSRRILVNAWNPAELDQAALPPCHVLFQLLPHVESKVLHMTMYQRSCDMFLGVPFNIASYALLLELFAAWSGYMAGTLTMFLADAHIYVNHLDQVKEQLGREPLPLPLLKMHLPAGVATLPLDELLARLHPEDIFLDGYQSHAAIKAPMAV
jgi:thymidylate synthase